MRIVHVSDVYLPRLGGIELHVRDLAARQQAAGHDITVLTAARTVLPEDAEAGVVRLPGRVRPVVLSAAAPLAAARLVREAKPDVVHVHVAIGSPVGFWAARTAARAGLPVVVTVHSLWGWATPIMRAADALGGFSGLPIRWTAVSRVAAEHVQRVLPPGSEVGVLPNGIDPASWQVSRAPSADEVVLVAAMRMAPRKRPMPLLRLLAEARRQVPAEIRVRAVLVGDGPRLPAMRRFVERHGMADWVELPGRLPRERIRELYRTADAFLAPAELESFGIAALEARCAGVPVVARAGSGVTEFVGAGRDGLLVDDDDAMREAVVALCRDPQLRAQLSGGGAVPARVTWPGVLAATEQAYEQAAGAVGQLAAQP
jgi:glycosyltransferase involved in cell wall biosynthesis